MTTPAIGVKIHKGESFESLHRRFKRLLGPRQTRHIQNVENKSTTALKRKGYIKKSIKKRHQKERSIEKQKR